MDANLKLGKRCRLRDYDGGKHSKNIVDSNNNNPKKSKEDHKEVDYANKKDEIGRLEDVQRIDRNCNSTKAKKAKILEENNAHVRPEYILDLDLGLLKIKPYVFTYRTFVKGRWQGKTIKFVFEKEFRDRPIEYYCNAIEKGKITINDLKVDPQYVLKNGDVLRHTIHRHEPPVLLEFPKIIFESDELLVVNKPCSIPVHPSGRYYSLSLLNILASSRSDFSIISSTNDSIDIPDFNYKTLYPIHRLDRLTSGIILLAKTKEFSQLAMKSLEAKEFQKIYLARVKGVFPKRSVDYDIPDSVIEDVKLSDISESDTVVKIPLYTESYKLGLNMAYLSNPSDTSNSNNHSGNIPQPKTAITIIKRYSGDNSDNSKTSMVECRPVTGRTHQIRIHLQFLGYPIANDPLYCCSAVWGSKLGKNGLVCEDEKRNIVDKMHNHLFPYTDIDNESLCKNSIPGDIKDKEFDCSECMIRRKDPRKESLEIWLHAWKISIPTCLFSKLTLVSLKKTEGFKDSHWKITSDEKESITFSTSLPGWSKLLNKDSREILDNLRVNEEKLEREFWDQGGRWFGEIPGEII